jgi:hypothetical protein
VATKIETSRPSAASRDDTRSETSCESRMGQRQQARDKMIDADG